MRIYGLILAAMMPGIALGAETYVCIAEAGAVAQDKRGGGFEAGEANVSSKKFIQSNASGKWQVVSHENNLAIFDQCTSEFHCEHSGGFAGIFMRSPKTNSFTVSWLGMYDDGRESIAVAKGRCSRL